MINLARVGHIFILSIYEPREVDDETSFKYFLNDLLKEESFGLILKVSGERSFNLESKKYLNYWFKEHKSWLGKNCIGFVRVKDKQDICAPEKLETLKKAFPFKYHEVVNIDIAYDLLAM